MGQIYHHATLTNIWLGEPGSRIRSDLKGLHIIAQVISSWKKYPSTMKQFPEFLNFRALKSVLQNHLSIMESALNNTVPMWHTRAWIVQEFVLAVDTFICCGALRIRYDDAWLLALRSYASVVPVGDFFDLTERVFDMALLREEWLNRQYPDNENQQEQDVDRPGQTYTDGPDLVDALDSVSGKDATDAKDHVYSLLGMVTEKEAALIGCDYELSCAEIYARATFANIRQRNSFDVFDFVKVASPLHYQTSENKHVQSWLPTGILANPVCHCGKWPPHPMHPADIASWSVNFDMKGFSYTRAEFRKDVDDHGAHCIFNSCRTLPNATASYDASINALNISGYCMDTISKILILDLDSSFIGSRHQAKMIVRHALASMERKQQTSYMGHLMIAIGMLPRHEITSWNQDLATGLQEADFANNDAALLDETTLAHADQASEVSGDEWAVEAFTLWDDLTTARYKQPQRKSLRESPDIQKYWKRWCRKLRDTKGGLCLFSTTSGAIGIAPPTILVDDTIVLVRSHRPFLALRNQGDHYTFEAQVFIHGYPDESFWKAVIDLSLEQETFILR